MKTPSKETQAAWRALLSVSKSLVESIERDLKAADLAPLAWYDVLLEIEKAGEDGIRPFELQERLLLPQYGMSRLLDRMDTAGLIRRETFGDDRRGQSVFLTPEGKAMRERIWPVYAGFLADRIGGALSEKDAIVMRDLLRKLA
ncbi:MarR family winged helix-turn-helix transcriptional regulator [uncultured Roseobacter sp.]|uniref:MarR family winged helix-turn-helix transcriptional regulator n=1 Tax=uncultured Roseobacter sp. TaxID=114847 RepID=UPI00262080B5|nr:MarR family winged helix-turn-helix transcriptional regulator [uncultured Roseobacter sp.]